MGFNEHGVLNMTGRNPEAVDFGPFRFVPGDGLWRNGSPVPLPPRAMGVLATLVARPGSVVSKQELMDAVWPDTFVTESSLLEAIGLLRQTFGDDRAAADLHPDRASAGVQVHRGELVGSTETPATRTGVVG